jgi:hypothetical protein
MFNAPSSDILMFCVCVCVCVCVQENRDELITRVSSIKKQILGSHDNWASLLRSVLLSSAEF